MSMFPLGVLRCKLNNSKDGNSGQKVDILAWPQGSFCWFSSWKGGSFRRTYTKAHAIPFPESSKFRTSSYLTSSRWTFSVLEICCRRLAPILFVPFSYFCTCWKVRLSASPSFSWLMPSRTRRMRTRDPTCLSIGLGVFFTPLGFSSKGRLACLVAKGQTTSPTSKCNLDSCLHAKIILQVGFSYLCLDQSSEQSLKNQLKVTVLQEMTKLLFTSFAVKIFRERGDPRSRQIVAQ